MSDELNKSVPSTPQEDMQAQLDFLSESMRRLQVQNERLSQGTGVNLEDVSEEPTDALSEIATSVMGDKNVIGWKHVKGSKAIIDPQTYFVTDNQLYDVAYSDGTTERLPYEAFRQLITKNRRPIKLLKLLVRSTKEGSYGMFYTDDTYRYMFSMEGEEPKSVSSFRELRNGMVIVKFEGEEEEKRMSKAQWETGKMVKAQLGRFEGDSSVYDGEIIWIHAYAIDPA